MERREIKEVFSYLEMNQKSLTQYQSGFIKSLKKHYLWKGTLSSRQIDCLLSLRDYLLSFEDNLAVIEHQAH